MDQSMESSSEALSSPPGGIIWGTKGGTQGNNVIME